MFVEYKKNKLKQSELHLLLQSDTDFDPNLSVRVNIEDYSKKIIENAELFEAYCNGKIAGVIAVYANDYVQKNAYITYVYCKQEYRKMGITATLLKNVIDYVYNKEFKRIYLECSINNNAAVNLYKKFDFFVQNKNSNDRVIMLKNIIQED